MESIKSLGVLAGIAGVSCFNQVSAINPDTQAPPNIVVITVHDLGQHLGCYGITSVQSPNLDKLASKGIMFKNFYSTSAVSSPGRGSLLTGRYPQSNGLMGLTHAPWWWKLNSNEIHIAELLKNNGYKTTLIGLTHVGEPVRLGFEKHLSPKNNPEETVLETANIFNTARKTDKPVFLKIGFTEVHSPYKHGTDSAKGIFVPGYLMATSEIRQEFAKYQGDIKFMDECVGKILNAIEKSELADNTIIIFTSDHGIGFPGAKWTARKAGIEVPFIIYRPNSIFSGGKIFYEIMSNVDVLPTLLEYAGFSIPDNIEGVSFNKFIAGELKVSPRRSSFAQYTADMKRDNQSRTVISGKYQLIRYFDAGRSVGYPLNISPSRFAAHIERENTTGSRPYFQLYNIEDDPFELADIGADKANAEIVVKLSKELMGWMKSVNDPLLSGPIATPYYEKAMEDFNGTVH